MGLEIRPAVTNGNIRKWRNRMSQIIITLNKNDIGDLLLGGEVHIKPSVQEFDNLTDAIIKLYEHSYEKAEEVNDENY